jgi:multisubunit Na+/H+ antiporter MnhF subunit
VTAYTICLVALLVGALLPALAVAGRGQPEDRLVGLEIVSSVTVVALIVFSQVGPGQSYDLTLPLVLVPLSVAGTLVFTRLLAGRDD